MTTRLKLVATVKQPQPSLEYEWRQRQDIAARDWAKVHITADRRAPLFIPDRVRRLWRA